MQYSMQVLSGLVLLMVLVLVPVATAEDEQLLKALDLFERQEYAAAQEMLTEVNRDSLNEEEQADFDRLEQTLPLAIAGTEQAAKDMSEAELAFEQGSWDEAEQRYQAVLENEFALSTLKAKASIRRGLLEEKRRLAEAAAPEGVIEAEPIEQPIAAEEPSATEEAPAPRRLTPIDEMRLRDDLLWQRAVAQAQDLSVKAREAIEKKEFTRARQLAEFALQKIEAARSYAEPVAKYLAAKESAERLKREVADALAIHQTHEAEKERVEIAERVTRRRELLEQHRREKVEQLFNTAAQLRQQQRFSEAAEVLRQIRHIDPANAKARDQLEIAEDYASLYAQREWHHDLYKQTRDALVNAQSTLIPWDYEVLYPKNWLELSARRMQAGVGIGGVGEDSELESRLEEILPEFQFHEAPLEMVVEHLREAQDINIAVDWDDLDRNGIGRDKPVSISLRGLPYRTVLKEVLGQVGGEVPLAFSVTEGLLRIATKDKLDRNKFVLVYDIRDLLIGVAQFSKSIGADRARLASQSGSRGGAGLFESPGHSSGGGLGDNAEQGLAGQLITIIQQNVETDSWLPTGEADASIRELNGQLIVYNTSEAHSQIRGLLEQLRDRRTLQVAVEARFLDVISNFLEEFGVDLDFVFNSASAGFDQGYSAGQPLIDPFSGAAVLIPRQYSRIGSTPATPAFGVPLQSRPGVTQPYGQAGFVPYGTGISPHFSEMTPITASQNTFSIVDIGTLGTKVPGSFGGRGPGAIPAALNIAGSFLDNLQVDFLIRATQANARSAIVQAPRLVMENGATSYVQVGRSRSYVASIQPTVAEGAALPRPEIEQAEAGVVLGVTSVISNDRRYVTVNVIADQFEDPSFDKFEVQRASGNSPGVFVMLRDQRFVTVRTQVAIPDGGTVLLGGMKQVGEVEAEAGVPILSKIPILKRFFTNRATIKDTRTLLILTKVKIIIQSEAEQEAFPTFSSISGG